MFHAISTEFNLSFNTTNDRVSVTLLQFIVLVKSYLHKYARYILLILITTRCSD